MSKKILITGGTGLIGKSLSTLLLSHGHEVSVLSRSKKSDGSIQFFEWDIEKGYIEEGALDVDFVIHLAGAGVADKRWTDDRKKAILESRLQSTALLKKELSKIKGKRPGYIGASAIGIYGNQDDHALSEEEVSQDRSDFLVDVVHQWEEAHRSLQSEVSSLAIIRIGIVLSTEGGALKPMLIPFNFRMGNYFGDGSQVFSWIHINDLCRIFTFIIEHSLDGVYNGVAPHPVNGKELVRSIAESKPGPFVQFGVPEFMLKLIFGEMSEAILMSSKVSADKILDQKFHFEFDEINPAIKNLLHR
ncbi:TIGR01777 family oxidoreductase [Portibacter lacus]|uniref:NAD-dependent epimerase n=1 Tax=Portibacter lacus TaxID=1099794 RepID=A0AA37SPZ2_9BACT|nr:TIGR01777 family oxidoreductase [Portibacter lacus]GLR18623.1 NAD-dependent epimerase [Portibacter lacus]